ncbi:MAG TPA: DUF1282 domain-containing protein, partial [Methanoculleus sp.]|nr:DUF1282 domain-containing protein [Methanoculleus sp.]
FFDGMFTGEKPDLKIPVVIVLVIALLSGVTAMRVSSVTAQLMPAELAGMGAMMGAFGFIAAFIMAFLMWVIWAALFHGISALRGGKGSFNNTLAVAGYGFAPQIISGIISAAVSWWYFSGVTLPVITDPLQIQEVAKELMAAPELMAVSAIGMVFYLWSANIWIFGLMEARRIGAKDAAIAVLIPFAALALFTLWQYIG